MTQPQQAAVNALGGYWVGRLEGTNSGNGNGGGGGTGRVPSKRALSRLLEYQKGAYGAHIDYLGEYSKVAQGHADAEHQLNERAAAAGHSRQRDLNDQAHLHTTEQADQAHLHKVAEDRLNANLQRSQIRTIAKVAPGMKGAGVSDFENTADGVKLRFFEPQAKKGKKGKKGKGSGGAPSNGTPPSTSGTPTEPVQIPDSFAGMHPDELAKWEEHRPSMTPQQKAAHRRETNKHNNPPKAPAPAKPEGLNETIRPDD